MATTLPAPPRPCPSCTTLLSSPTTEAFILPWMRRTRPIRGGPWQDEGVCGGAEASAAGWRCLRRGRGRSATATVRWWGRGGVGRIPPSLAADTPALPRTPSSPLPLDLAVPPRCGLGGVGRRGVRGGVGASVVGEGEIGHGRPCPATPQPDVASGG